MCDLCIYFFGLQALTKKPFETNIENSVLEI
jgi:hypothetical protein